MIDYALYWQIRSLRQDQKLTVSQIARQLQLDKKTVRYWLKHDYHQAPRPRRGSKLDPYKPRIRAWLEAHDLSAQQVLQRLQAEGLDVRYTIVADYVRRVRPKPVQAFLSLHFAPGECLQVDWGSWGTIPSARPADGSPSSWRCSVTAACFMSSSLWARARNTSCSATTTPSGFSAVCPKASWWTTARRRS
jgi:hypothetical protein